MRDKCVDHDDGHDGPQRVTREAGATSANPQHPLFNARHFFAAIRQKLSLIWSVRVNPKLTTEGLEPETFPKGQAKDADLKTDMPQRGHSHGSLYRRIFYEIAGATRVVGDKRTFFSRYSSTQL